jgi:hypothetical protein
VKKKLTMLAAFCALTIFAVPAVSAAPAAAVNVQPGAKVILVAGGCGVGWHRGPYGGCRRNLSPRWPCWWRRGPYSRWHLICR